MGSEGRARLSLAGLLAFTLFSFGLVFAEGDYPGPALLAMIIAQALVVALRRTGASSALTLGALAVGLLVYLTLIFQAQRSFYGLPTPEALGGLVRSVAHALELSRVDFAPVPVRAGYVVLLVTALWCAAAIGELATFRWRRPLAAVSLPTVMFAVALVVGTRTAAPLLVAGFLTLLLTYLGFESAHRLRSWGRWVPNFPGQAAAEPEAVASATARRMGATCIVAALVAPAFLPAVGDGLVAWRSGVGLGRGGPGGGRGATLDPLVSIAPRLINQDDQEMFQVRSPVASYWRLVTLVEFDGVSWRPAEEPTVPLTDGRMPGGAVVPARAELVETVFQLEGLRGDYLPGALHVLAVETPSDALEQRLRANPETGDLGAAGGLPGGVTYEVTSAIPDLGYDDLVNASVGDPGPEYVARPELSPEVIELRDSWIEGAETTFERLVALQDSLRDTTRFTYTLTPEDALSTEQRASVDHLTRFLTETRAGYCQQFATAFALLARSLGYPTRISIGFLSGDREARGSPRFHVRGTDAHAWPEVFFEGFGWVPFEPTPRGDRLAAEPTYTIPDPLFDGGSLGFGDGALVRGRANGRAGDQEPFARRDLNDLGRSDGGPALSLPAPGALLDLSPPEDPAWARAFRRLALTLALALAALLTAVPPLKEARRRAPYRRARDARAAAEAAFAEFCAEAAELLRPRQPAESAVAYARRVAQARRIPADPALRLAALYEAAQYAPAPPGSAAAAEARRLARQLRGALWAGASVWEKALRLFAPRGLVSGRP
jgi:transglutaminase-like putative cysteine protease